MRLHALARPGGGGSARPAPEPLGPAVAYDVDRPDAVQTFELPGPSGPTDAVRLEVLSNHGLQGWTCVYRLRVHGVKA